MVHAYLMYGFPTQTAQETIDSMEMVRQMFAAGILQSAFWHQFAMTAHSPVGLNPAAYSVVKETEAIGTFANNDIVHQDPTGAEHEQFSYGLKKSLFNYMNGVALDHPLHKWFEFKVPRTSVPQDYITKALEEEIYQPLKLTAKVIYNGTLPLFEITTKSKKGSTWEVASLTYYTQKETVNIKLEPAQGQWLAGILPRLSVTNLKPLTLAEVKAAYEAAGLEDFELFWENKPVNGLWRVGLLVV